MKTERRGFTEVPNVECERKKEIEDDFKVFDLVIRRMELSFTEMRKNEKRVGFRKIKNPILDMLSLGCLSDIQVEMSTSNKIYKR